MTLGRPALALALAWAAYGVRPAVAAEPAAPAAPKVVDLQSPEARDTRNTAFSLPTNTWGFDLGALGINGPDAFARLGVAYGVGAGVELDLNLAHASVGLINLAGRWHFVDTRFFHLGASLGIWYGHGGWVWILHGAAKKLIQNLDVINVPVALTASMPVARWIQFDLTAQYTHAEVFGNVLDTDSAFFNGQIGLRQVETRPGVRLFLSDSTELDVTAGLPIYTGIPRERNSIRPSEDDRVKNYSTVPFADHWALETGVRSALARGVFGSLRLHFGPLPRELYGASVYPSFDVEVRR